MKLSDFARAGELKTELDYLTNLRRTAGKERAVKIGALDVRPDLAEAMRRTLDREAYEAQEVVKQKMKAIGVDPEDD